MDFDIRYARLSDGTAVPYTSFGEGPALMVLGKPKSGLGLLSLSSFHIRLSQQHTMIFPLISLVMSTAPLNVAAESALAIADDLGISTFAVLGFYREVPPAIAISAASPTRATAAVFWSGVASNTELASTSRVQAQEHLMSDDWDLYVEQAARRFTGWDDSSQDGARFADWYRSLDTDSMRAGVALSAELDATELLPLVRIPALVAHRRGASSPTVEQVEGLAAALPNATLKFLDGNAMDPQYGDTDDAIQAVESFLQPHDGMHPVGKPTIEAAFQTIMFTDLESSTALTQKVGDEAAQVVLHGHNDAVRRSLEDNGGREVKHTGDGIMAAFPSAVRAVEAALQIQRDLAGGEVRVRIGLNAGEPIAEDDDFFGTAVQLAARVCDRAEPGQVLVSNVVRELCAGKKLTFTHHADATLKGFDEPVALFEAGS